MTQEPQTPAGWYDDRPGLQRWWDGSSWTEHVHASGAVQPGDDTDAATEAAAADARDPDALRAELLEALRRLDEI